MDLSWAPDNSCVVAAHQRSGKVSVLEVPGVVGLKEAATCPLKSLV